VGSYTVIRALDSAALIMWIEMTVVAELATIKGKRAHSNIIHSALNKIPHETKISRNLPNNATSTSQLKS
jgi:hypothetical protein